MTGRACATCGCAVPQEGPLAGLCPACLLSSVNVHDERTLAEDALELDSESSATVAPAWSLVALLGQSEWGRTYLGRAAAGSVFVVVRVPHADVLSADGARALVERQQRLAGRPVHPNLATVLDAGFTADGRPFVVRDYVPGVDVRAWRRRCRDDAAANRVLERVREALAALHDAGVTHNHLVADNVLVIPGVGGALPVLTDAALHDRHPAAAPGIGTDLVDFGALGADPHSHD